MATKSECKQALTVYGNLNDPLKVRYAVLLKPSSVRPKASLGITSGEEPDIFLTISPISPGNQIWAG